MVLERQTNHDAGGWAALQNALSRGIVGGSPTSIIVRVDVFLAALSEIRKIRETFRVDLQMQPHLREHLERLAGDRRAREAVALSRDSGLADPERLQERLRDAGFARELKDFQLENLGRLLRLPHGADFSVPGAGKTTVALANYTLLRERGKVSQLLVIGPIAAFQAWKDDSAACITPAPKISVHTGTESVIPLDTELLLTNYNRLALDYDRIRSFVSRGPTQVILDEAHRIKLGAAGVHGRAALDLAYAAARRDVLTGTPAPQGAYDLVAPMRFLYPGQDHQILPAEAYVEKDGREDGVLRATSAAISRYFVRTPKSRLGLRTPIFEVVSEPMRPIQHAIYESLLGSYRGAFPLEERKRHALQRLGRVVMYLLEAATNPMLLVAGSDSGDESGFVHPPLELTGREEIGDLLAQYRSYEAPWKYDWLRSAVADAASRGEKVLVWSTFVRNLRALRGLLADFEPAMVHGGVPPEDGAPHGVVTREAELRRFKFDSGCSVLLANPAAAGEGVSLHHWCHHAVYLDRTFNAGHFLQSQDRIHRLGLSATVETRFSLLLSQETIDHSVDGRLRDKVVALSRLMNDPGLVQVALPESDDPASVDDPAALDDCSTVSEHVRGERGR